MLPISALALLLALAAPRADDPPSARGVAQTDTAIARIRGEYARVNAMLARCENRTLDVNGMSTEGGTMKIYRCGGAIRKLAVTYYGEMGRASEEWVLSGDRPIFLYRLDSDYDQTFGRVVRRTEERVYWRGEQMLRWIRGGRTRVTVSAEARGRMGEMEEEFADLLDRARTGRTDAK